MTTAAPTKAPSDLKLVREFFGLNLSQMKTEWTPMSDADKADIAGGLRNGTLTY